MPVVQFDRYAQTDCPVVSERTIGGYAFGISGAQKIVKDLGAKGGNVLAFRILPGVDVLEQRWGAARKIFEENPQINVIGVEFVAYDSFKASTVVSDYLAKYGNIDAVWMDAGGTAVTILEAFKDAGDPYPKVMVGEDQQDFLEYWKANNINGIAPTFSTFSGAPQFSPLSCSCRARLSSTTGFCPSRMSPLPTWINTSVLECPRCIM